MYLKFKSLVLKHPIQLTSCNLQNVKIIKFLNINLKLLLLVQKIKQIIYLNIILKNVLLYISNLITLLEVIFDIAVQNH